LSYSNARIAGKRETNINLVTKAFKVISNRQGRGRQPTKQTSSKKKKKKAAKDEKNKIT
jgi:hypothetical protein